MKTKWREKHPPARRIQWWSSNKKSKYNILSFFIDPSDLVQRNIHPQIIGRTDCNLAKLLFGVNLSINSCFHTCWVLLLSKFFFFPQPQIHAYFLLAWKAVWHLLCAISGYSESFQQWKGVFSNAYVCCETLKMYCVSFPFFFFLLCVPKVDHGPGRS